MTCEPARPHLALVACTSLLVPSLTGHSLSTAQAPNIEGSGAQGVGFRGSTWRALHICIAETFMINVGLLQLLLRDGFSIFFSASGPSAARKMGA